MPSVIFTFSYFSPLNRLPAGNSALFLVINDFPSPVHLYFLHNHFKFKNRNLQISFLVSLWLPWTSRYNKFNFSTNPQGDPQPSPALFSPTNSTTPPRKNPLQQNAEIVALRPHWSRLVFCCFTEIRTHETKRVKNETARAKSCRPSKSKCNHFQKSNSQVQSLSGWSRCSQSQRAVQVPNAAKQLILEHRTAVWQNLLSEEFELELLPVADGKPRNDGNELVSQ